MAPAQSAQFVYDGLGRCVKRTIGNVTTVITYDEWKPIAEWNGAGGLVAWNLYGPGADEVLVRHQAGTSTYLYYHLDAMGHVVFLLDGNGGVLERYSYDAFGRPKMMDGYGAELTTTAYGNRFLFTGREYLPTLGIYDYRNRVYHPGLGRFLQVDPIGFKGDASNLYRYCGGNPINRSDSTGLDQDDPQEVPHMLTSWGKGDWISGANGLGYNDKQRHFSAGMGGGGGGPGGSGGSGQGGPKPISPKTEGKKVHWKETGNWDDENMENHYQKGLDKPGKTISKISVAENKDGSITVTHDLNWWVNDDYRGTDVVTREIDHVKAYRAWQREGDGHDITKSYQPVDTMRSRLDNSHATAWRSELYVDRKGGPHDLLVHPAKAVTAEHIANVVRSIK